jgi:flagellar protein FlaG
MILFIASMLIAASVAGVFTNSVQQLSGAIDDQGLAVSDNVRTDIEIISDNGTGACVYNCSGSGNLTLLVKNTGSQRLDAQSEQIELLINGQFQVPGDITIEVLGESDTWDRGTVIRMNVTEDLPSDQDNRAKVIVNGDEEVFEFRT